MGACGSLKTYSRQCGKNAKAGFNPDVYLIAFDDLVNLAGTTEVFEESVTGLITEIGLGTVAPIIKFVKVGSVLNQGAISENYTYNENGTFDITKELSIAINNIGTVESRTFVESLIGLPVAALVKLNSGAWIAFGLNGQFILKTSVGTVDTSSNGRVLTLNGSDSVLIQTVDPTIVADLIA